MHVFSYNVGNITYAVIHEGCKTTIQGKSKKMLITITFSPPLRREFRFIKQGFNFSCVKNTSACNQEGMENRTRFSPVNPVPFRVCTPRRLSSLVLSGFYFNPGRPSDSGLYLLQTYPALWAWMLSDLPSSSTFCYTSNISWQLVESPAFRWCVVLGSSYLTSAGSYWPQTNSSMANGPWSPLISCQR